MLFRASRGQLMPIKKRIVRMLKQAAATEGVPNVVLATVRATKLDHLVPDHAKPDADQQPAPARIAQRLRAFLRARSARRPLSAGTLRSASGLAIKQREPATELPTPAAEVCGRAAARIVANLSGSPRSHQPLEGNSQSAWSGYCAGYCRPQQ